MTFRYHIDSDYCFIANEAQEFATLGEAIDDAKANARDIPFECLRAGKALSEPCVEISDDSGKLAVALSVSEVFDHSFQI